MRRLRERFPDVRFTQALNEATAHLAEVMMNRSVQAALSGKHIDRL